LLQWGLLDQWDQVNPEVLWDQGIPEDLWVQDYQVNPEVLLLR
jgi:hypothetical protein